MNIKNTNANTRINIVGGSGMGKSTLAHELAQYLGCPHIEMDALFWLPNWQQRQPDDFIQQLNKALSHNAWVLDGNFHATAAVKWQNVDMIVWLDYPFALNFARAFQRAIKRIISRKELWHGTGNTESFRQTFLSKDSILLWTIKTYRSNRRRYSACMSDPDWSHIQWVRLRSPKQTRAFLDSFKPSA